MSSTDSRPGSSQSSRGKKGKKAKNNGVLTKKQANKQKRIERKREERKAKKEVIGNLAKRLTADKQGSKSPNKSPGGKKRPAPTADGDDGDDDALVPPTPKKTKVAAAASGDGAVEASTAADSMDDLPVETPSAKNPLTKKEKREIMKASKMAALQLKKMAKVKRKNDAVLEAQGKPVSDKPLDTNSPEFEKVLNAVLEKRRIKQMARDKRKAAKADKKAAKDARVTAKKAAKREDKYTPRQQQKKPYVPPRKLTAANLKEDGTPADQQSTDYTARSLRAAEAAGYKAAGILPYRVMVEDDKERIDVLMACEVRPRPDQIELGPMLNFLGGKREPEDESAVHTACREFHEETGSLLSKSARKRILNALTAETAPTEEEAQKEEGEDGQSAAAAAADAGPHNVFWYTPGKYALFLHKMEQDVDIDEKYRAVPKEDRAENSAAEALHWVPLKSLLRSTKKKSPEQPTMVTIPSPTELETSMELQVFKYAAQMLHDKGSLAVLLRRLQRNLKKDAAAATEEATADGAAE